MNLVITVSADVLAPNGDSPSAGTAFTVLIMFLVHSMVVDNFEYLFTDHKVLFKTGNEISQGIMAQS